MRIKKILYIPLLYLFVTASALFSQTNNIQSGLYISTLLKANFVPYLDGGFNVSLYYRFLSDSFPGYEWDGIKTDVGIENYFTAERNALSIFVNTSISKYFDLKTRTSIVNYYTVMKRGFISFDSINSDYGLGVINDAAKTDDWTFEAEIVPTLKVSVLDFLFDKTGLILQAGVAIKYGYANRGNYYYDYDLLMLRSKNDFSYKFDALIIFDITPISVGIHYRLIFMQNTKALGHSIGAYAHFEYYFLNRFYVESQLYIGQYIAYPNFSGKLYFDLEAMLSYRII